LHTTKFGAGRVAAAFPFDRSRESSAAAAAQIRPLHFVEHALSPESDRGAERGAWLVARAEKRVRAANVVLDVKIICRPFCDRDSVAHEIANLIDAARGEPRYRSRVDERCWPLVAHAGAGGEIDADSSVRRNLAATEPETLQHVLEQRQAAQHAVGDVVREQDPIATARRVIKKRIELHDALDAGRLDAKPGGDGARGLRRNPPKLFLRLAQDL
jgi:hypothetical protein